MDEASTTAALREAGARFALVHGSRARGDHHAGSDLDVAAWWGRADPPASWDLVLPAGVDLVVLDRAPLWLAGRVAQEGRVLFEDDRDARVVWQADTRLQYLDYLPQRAQDTAEYLAAIARG